MGLYEILGIQDNWTDAEIATYLSMQRSAWNSRRVSPKESERREAELRVRQIDVLEGAEARLGDFIRPALVIKTLCSAIDNRYSDYYGLEEGLIRSCSLGNFRGEFRSVMGYLNQIGETELLREWKETLDELGVEVPMPRKKRPEGEAPRQERRQQEELSGERRERAKRSDAEERGPGTAGRRREEETAGRERGGRPPKRRTKGASASSGREENVLNGLFRSIRRFFRKVKRAFRRIRWSEIPKRIWAVMAVILAAIVVLIVLIGRVNTTRRAAAEQKAQEEAAAAASLAAAEQVKQEQETLLSALKGMDNFRLRTDATEFSAYQSVKPASCNASSVLVGTTGKSYGTEYLFDGDPATSWQEGEDGDGVGVSITSVFAAKTQIRGIAFWNGSEVSQEKFEANNRLKDITVSVSCGGQTYSASYTLEDAMGEQVILFDQPVPMESVLIRIDSVYNGSVYQDTVLSELSFLTENSTADPSAGTAENSAADSSAAAAGDSVSEAATDTAAIQGE